MGKLIDLTGKRFGRLLVVERAGSCNGDALWLCKCDCGNEKVVNGRELRAGDTKSCGCYHHEVVSDMMKTHGASINGRDRLYGVWAAMLTRTRNPNSTNYKWYGGRGIKVCEEWHNYTVFRDWALSHGYDENAQYGKCTLDRIDDDGDYCPDNCRLVSIVVQANNQRSNKTITYNGETHNMKQWANKYNINYSTFKKYIYSGKTLDEIIKKFV